jgi:hypothetical protein
VRWNAVSRDAQALYIAILTLVDDYGRYDGRDSILWADAFTIWNELHPAESCGVERIPALRCELKGHLLVDFYEVGGKKCLQMLQWQERVRENAKEKWPANPNPLRNPAESCGILPPKPSPSPSPSPTPSSTPAAAPEPASRVQLPAAALANLVASVTHRALPDEAKKARDDCYAVLETRLCEFYKRKPGDRWTYAEQVALAEIARRESPLDEIDHILALRRSMPADERKRFFPQSLSSLLNKWTEMLDKANVQCPVKRPQANKQKQAQKKNSLPPIPAEKIREEMRKAINDKKL